MTIEYGRFFGAVLPGNPPFDKVAALCEVIYAVTGQLEWPSNFRIEYWRKNEEPATATKARWEREKFYPIDLGNNKYHSRKLGSACEVVAVDLGIERSIFGWLVAIANQNNKTGYLKGAASRMNMPYILRELYKPQMFISTEVAVEAAAHLIFTELRYRMIHHQKLVRNESEMERFPRLVELDKRINFSKEEFTFSRYLHLMFFLGYEEGEILRRVEWWLKCLRNADRLTEVAGEKATTMQKTEFELCGHRCVHVRTDDDRIARALFTGENPPAIILCERRLGSFQILTSRHFRGGTSFHQSMRELKEYLSRNEPDGAKWFLDERIWAIMNGSRSLSDSTPSVRTASCIVKVIQEHIKLPKLSV